MSIDSVFQDRSLSLCCKSLFQSLHETEHSNLNKSIILRIFSHSIINGMFEVS